MLKELVPPYLSSYFVYFFKSQCFIKLKGNLFQLFFVCVLQQFDVFLLTQARPNCKVKFVRGEIGSFLICIFCSRRTLYGLRQKVQYCQNFTEITAVSRNVFWESGRKGDLETTSKQEIRMCGRMGANKGMSAAKINPNLQ